MASKKLNIISDKFVTGLSFFIEFFSSPIGGESKSPKIISDLFSCLFKQFGSTLILLVFDQIFFTGGGRGGG